MHRSARFNRELSYCPGYAACACPTVIFAGLFRAQKSPTAPCALFTESRIMLRNLAVTKTKTLRPFRVLLSGMN